MARIHIIFILLIIYNVTSLSLKKKVNYHRINNDKNPSQAQSTSYDPPFANMDWNAMGRKSLQNTINNFQKIYNKKAKNVILFLGDGMGLATVAASRVYNSQLNNLKGEDIYMSWEKFPFSSLSRTYNVDRVTPDSAGTSTAYLGGVKANLGTIGVNENVKRYNCTSVRGNEVESIGTFSNQIDKWTGIITTSEVTDASPAGVYAHAGDREWEAFIPDYIVDGSQCTDIAQQLVTNPVNQNIRVILGGGYQNFVPDSVNDEEFGQGLRKDGRNLINEWMTSRVNSTDDDLRFVRNKNQFDLINPQKTNYLMGLFSGYYMDYEVDRNPKVQPSISEMTKKAIEILRKNVNGYFLFVEGGKIDLAHHDNVAYKALNDTLALSQAVQLAYDMTDPSETLIVVTADHSHTFVVGAYGAWTDSIFGFANLGENAMDGKPYLQLSYINGPGYALNRMDDKGNEVLRKNLTGANNLEDPNFVQDAGVWLDYETHGGEDVAVYASGPMAHLFQSTNEESYVAHVMMYASCVGQYTSEQHCTPPSNGSQAN